MKNSKNPIATLPGEVRYRILPARPEAHLYAVSCALDVPDPQGQRYALPAWIPGSYMIREFARHIVSIRAESRGRAVRIEKLDKHTWRAAPVDGPLVVHYEVYAWDLSVRGAHLDTSHGFFNGTSVFLRPLGCEQQTCLVEIAPPAGGAYSAWRVATSLPRMGAPAGGFGRYAASNYDELIDHPVEMGSFARLNFRACGVPHEMAITGVQDADTARLARDLKKICETQIRFWNGDGAAGGAEKTLAASGNANAAAAGANVDTPAAGGHGKTPAAGGRGVAPMDRYVFLTTALGEGYGGLEHRASTALMCSRADLPRRGVKEISESYRGFLGLCSHEYFHTWNVKRLKPAPFAPYDLDRENYTTLLWMFEGFTSYYDDLLLLRAGLIGRDSYLELLARAITSHLRTAGRERQTVAESSFDAWIKYYRQDENSPNAVVSYYVKGSLVALCLDLHIRERTRGRKSLDDVMRLMWRRRGIAGSGVGDDQVEAIAEEASGLRLRGFFDLAVRSTAELPLARLLGTHGVCLHRRAAKSATDKGGIARHGAKPGDARPAAPASLGARSRVDGKDIVLTHVLEGGAALQAGLAAGDAIVAVNGLRPRAGGLDALLEAHRPGDALQVLAFRRDELREFRVRLLAAPSDTCELSVDEARGRLLRKRWLEPMIGEGK